MNEYKEGDWFFDYFDYSKSRDRISNIDIQNDQVMEIVKDGLEFVHGDVMKYLLKRKLCLEDYLDKNKIYLNGDLFFSQTYSVTHVYLF